MTQSGSVEEMVAGLEEEGDEEGEADLSAEVKQEIEDEVDEDYDQVEFGEVSVKKDDDDDREPIQQVDVQDEDVEHPGMSSLVVTGKRKRKPRIIFRCEESEDEEEESSKSKKKNKAVTPVVPRVKCELCKRKMKSSYLEQHNRKFHKEEYKQEMEKRREERIKLRKARLLNPESTTNEAILAEMEKRRQNSLQRQGITEEEWESILERKRFQKLEKAIQMSEEERGRKKMEGFLRYQSWKAKFTKEEWQEMRRLEHKRRKQNLTEEKRKIILERNRERIRKLSGEKLEKHKNIFRRGTKKYLDKMRREEPDKYYEKVTVYSRRRYGEVAAKMLNYQRDRIKNETKEQREKRLLRYRVGQAKRKMRREMEKDGRSKEEIEEKLKEVEEQVKNMPRVEGEGPSKYKPRFGARKPHNIKNRKTTLPVHFVENCVQDEVSEVHHLETEQENVGELLSTSGLENINMAPAPVHQPCTVIPIDITHILNTTECNADVDTITGHTSFEMTCAKVPVIQYVKQIEIEFEGECGEIIPISSDAHHLPIFYDFYEDVGVGNLVSFTEDQQQIEESVVDVDISSVVEEPEVESALPELSTPQVLTQEITLDSLTLKESQVLTTSSLINELESEPIPESSIQEPPVPLPPDIPVPTTLEPLGSTSTRPEMCDECGKTFKTKGNLMEHKSLIHFMDPSKLACPKCSRPCPNTRVLWNHFVRWHVADISNFPKQLIPNDKEIPINSTNSQIAPLPSEATAPKSPSKSKVNTNRGNKFPNICDQCGKTFRQKCTLDDHYRRTHQGKGHICPVCGRDQQSAAKLWRHQIDRHKLKDIPPPPSLQMEMCKYCNEVIMRGYEQHVQKHHPEKLTEFQEWYEEVKKEKFKKQQNNPQKCPHCKSTYPNKRQLRRHVRHMHLESGGGGGGIGMPKMNRCPDCGKDFKRKNHLTRHLREIHGVEKIELKLEAEKMIKICNRFKSIAICLLCGGGDGGGGGTGTEVQMPGRNSIRAHFVSEHYQVFQEIQFDKIKVYCCEICEERFQKEIELREHLEQSHEEIEYKCKYCGVFKLSQQQLAVHQKNVHGEERRKVEGGRGRRRNKTDGEGGSETKRKIGRGRGRPPKKEEKLCNKLDKKLVIRLVRLKDDKIKIKKK